MNKIIFAAVVGMVMIGFVGVASASLRTESITVVTVADLDVFSAGTLPTSPLYFLKEWKRGISRVFTFGAIRNTELELNITNEKAGELIEVAKTKPDDLKAIEKTIKKYSEALDKLNARIAKLTENSENPKIAKLLEKLDERTAKHIVLLNQISESNVARDGSREEIEGVPNPSSLKLALRFKLRDCSEKVGTPSKDDDCDGIDLAIETAQAKLHATVVASVEKDSNLKQRASDQIVRAEVSIEQTVKPCSSSALPASAQCTMSVRIIQLIDVAKDHLERAKKAFAEEKYGEAFGQARSAEVIARGVVVTAIDTYGDKSATPTIPTPKPRSIPENSVAPKTPPSAGGGTIPAPETEPMFCPAQYDPVCGIDGKTYGNSCEAGIAKVAIKYAGLCGDSTTTIDSAAQGTMSPSGL